MDDERPVQIPEPYPIGAQGIVALLTDTTTAGELARAALASVGYSVPSVDPIQDCSVEQAIDAIVLAQDSADSRASVSQWLLKSVLLGDERSPEPAFPPEHVEALLARGKKIDGWLDAHAEERKAHQILCYARGGPTPPGKDLDWMRCERTAAHAGPHTDEYGNAWVTPAAPSVPSPGMRTPSGIAPWTEHNAGPCFAAACVLPSGHRHSGSEHKDAQGNRWPTPELRPVKVTGPAAPPQSDADELDRLRELALRSDKTIASLREEIRQWKATAQSNEKRVVALVDLAYWGGKVGQIHGALVQDADPWSRRERMLFASDALISLSALLPALAQPVPLTDNENHAFIKARLGDIAMLVELLARAYGTSLNAVASEHLDSFRERYPRFHAGNFGL